MRVLPYATYMDGTDTCPPALEAAVVLLTVESRRSKGTGFVLSRRDVEKVNWVSRLTWPMLAVPTQMPLASADMPSGEPAPESTRYLLFDLTGMVSANIPGFQLREGLDDQPGWGARLPVAEFAAFLGRQRDGLKQVRKPLLSTLSSLVRREAAAGDKVSGLIAGQQRQLAQDLARHAGEPALQQWDGVELPRRFDEAEARRVALEIDERMRAYLAQAAKVKEMARRLADEADTYRPELAQERERLTTNYAAQLEVLKPQVDEIIAHHQRNLEERLGALSAQYGGPLASLEADLTRAQNEEERYRGLGKEYEPQLAEARRARQQAQRALDAMTREKEAAMRQARDQFRELSSAENDKLNSLIKARDRDIQAVRDAESKLQQALTELMSAADAAAERDRAAASELAALTVDIADAGRGAAMEFGLPVYAARLEGQRARHVVIVPLSVRRSRSMSQRVTGLIGALTIPAEPRSPRYEQDLGRALASALETTNPESADAGVAAAVSAGARSTDVLADPGFRALALEGLDQLREDKWLSDKQHAEQRQAVEAMYG